MPAPPSIRASGPSLRRPLAAVLALAVWLVAAGVPEALALHADGGCCSGGVCCCRPGSREGGPCLRRACRCGGHDGSPASTPALRAAVPPAPFVLAVITTGDRAPSALEPSAAPGYAPRPFHPPRSSSAR